MTHPDKPKGEKRRENFAQMIERLRAVNEQAERDIAHIVLEHEDRCAPETIAHARYLLNRNQPTER